MNEFLLISGMAVITFSIRYVMFIVNEKMEFRGIIKRALGYVPSAVLSAIVLPAIVFSNGTTVNLSLSSPHIAGFIVSLIVGIIMRNVLMVICFGMGTFILWQNFFSKFFL
jgi:branched-subunit amino acid transport protein